MSNSSWWSKERRQARHAAIGDFVKEKFQAVADWFQDWWDSSGREEAEKLIRDTIGVYLSLYKEKLMIIVRDIAMGNVVKLDDKEGKPSQFARLFKEMLDQNDDGRISYADVPDSVVNFLREYVVGLWKGLGADNEERAAALEEE